MTGLMTALAYSISNRWTRRAGAQGNDRGAVVLVFDVAAEAVAAELREEQGALFGARRGAEVLDMIR